MFPDASKLNSFLGVTRRVGELRFLLMGQAMLNLHELGGHKFPPVGFFSAGSSEEDKDWLPMPVESNGLPSDGARFARSNSNCFVRDAMSDFGLRPDGEAGTSVVIPHPMDELTDPANLAYAVIRQYFHPIVAGDLVVDADGRRTKSAIAADKVEVLRSAVNPTPSESFWSATTTSRLATTTTCAATSTSRGWTT